MIWLVYGLWAAGLGWLLWPIFQRPWWPWRVFYTFIVIFSLAAVIRLHFGLTTWIYALESLILSKRFLAILIGFILGFLINKYRVTIFYTCRDIYNALLGTGGASQWALQSIFAILVLCLILLAAKPELFDHLKSIKAGEVEASFSDVSTTTREAIPHSIKDLSRDFSLESWSSFEENYLKGARQVVVNNFDNSIIKDKRVAIRDLVFLHYIVPLESSLYCLNKYDSLDAIKTDEFRRFVLSVKNQIILEDGSGKSFTETKWETLLSSIRDQTNQAYKIFHYVHDDSFDTQDPRCPKASASGNPSQTSAPYPSLNGCSSKQISGDDVHSDAVFLGYATSCAIQMLKDNDEKKYALSFLDPYFTAAVADLLAMTFGHDEKARFLMTVKEKYPADHNLLQPGIINIYYQLSEAKTHGNATWPLADEVEELARAMDGAEFIVSGANKSLTSAEYVDVNKVYYVNIFVFTVRFMEIYNERVLGGNKLEQKDSERWRGFYDRLSKIYNAKGFATGSETVGETEQTPFTERESDAWRSIEIPREFLFDGSIAFALSSVLLSESNRRAPDRICAIAKYHLGLAQDMIPNFDKLIAADRSRLKGYLSQIRARIDASC